MDIAYENATDVPMHSATSTHTHRLYPYNPTILAISHIQKNRLTISISHTPKKDESEMSAASACRKYTYGPFCS